MFGKKPEFTLDLTHNPLQCDCNEIGFVEWIQPTRISIKDKNKLTCMLSLENITEVDVEQLRVHCGLTVNTLVISTVSVGLVLLTITVSIIIYRFRWAIKWHVYKMRYRKGPNRDAMLLDDMNGDGKYSVYVIFPYDDDEARKWVYSTLRPLVEDDWQKPHMFLVGRDDIGGETKINNLVHGIMRSHTAIWVVCPAFLRDKHCETAANFAFEELGSANNLLLIMENQLDHYNKPGAFASLMNPKVCLSRLRYPQNEDGRQLFWAKLESFIPSWSQ
jgi:hypothetical protein